MKAITEDSRTIIFTDDHRTVGKLVYAGRLSGKAQIINEENQVFEIVSLDFWKRSFEIRMNGKPLMSFKKKWTGTTHIKTSMGAGETEYIFKHKGFFRSRYVLQDNDDRDMAVVSAKFQWKGFKYDFGIEISDSLKRRQSCFLLIALSVYLSKESIKQSASAGAVAAAT